MQQPETTYLSVLHFAERRGVHAQTVRKWLGLGLPHLRAGRVIRVRLPEADEWLDGGGARAQAELLARRAARKGKVLQ